MSDKVVKSEHSKLIPVLPVKFADWMRHIPVAFISMMSIRYVGEHVIETYPLLSKLSVVAGSFFFVTFMVLYVWDFVIPKVEYWTELSVKTKRQSIMSWIVISIFLMLYLSQGVYVSSEQLVIHVVVAYVISHALHTDI